MIFRELLHREMLFYYFAQREPILEIRTGKSFISAVARKMQPYADTNHQSYGVKRRRYRFRPTPLPLLAFFLFPARLAEPKSLENEKSPSNFAIRLLV